MKLVFKRRIPKQAEAFDDITSLYNILLGGYGSGKTALLAYKAVQLSYLNRGVPGGILSPSLPEFKRDFLPLMEEHIGAQIPGMRYYVQGRYGIHFTFPWTKAPLFVFSAEKAIKGPNLGWVLINEPSLMPWSVIQQMIARRRVPCPTPQIVFGGTPEDEYDWLDGFIERGTKAGNMAVRSITTLENPFNDPSYGKELLANMDEETAQIYVYGKPGRIGKNSFFYAYRPDLNDYPIERIDGELVHATLDFNVGRMSCGFAHVIGTGERKQIVYFDELVLLNKSSDTEEMGRAILARYNRTDVLVTCDASGKSRKTSGRTDVQILEGMGLKVRYSNRNPPIRRSQLQCNGLLAKRKILLNPKTCPGLRRDLLRIEQKGDFEMDKSNETLTHMSDGMRYLVYHEFPDYLDRSFRSRYSSQDMGTR